MAVKGSASSVIRVPTTLIVWAPHSFRKSGCRYSTPDGEGAVAVLLCWITGLPPPTRPVPPGLLERRKVLDAHCRFRHRQVPELRMPGQRRQVGPRHIDLERFDILRQPHSAYPAIAGDDEPAQYGVSESTPRSSGSMPTSAISWIRVELGCSASAAVGRHGGSPSDRHWHLPSAVSSSPHSPPVRRPAGLHLPPAVPGPPARTASCPGPRSHCVPLHHDGRAPCGRKAEFGGGPDCENA